MSRERQTLDKQQNRLQIRFWQSITVITKCIINILMPTGYISLDENEIALIIDILSLPSPVRCSGLDLDVTGMKGLFY